MKNPLLYWTILAGIVFVTFSAIEHHIDEKKEWKDAYYDLHFKMHDTIYIKMPKAEFDSTLKVVERYNQDTVWQHYLSDPYVMLVINDIVRRNKIYVDADFCEKK